MLSQTKQTFYLLLHLDRARLMKNLVIIYSIIVYLLLQTQAKVIQQDFSPSNVVRISTKWQWCPCGTGLDQLILFPKQQSQDKATISIKQVNWLKYYDNVSHIQWRCSDENSTHTTFIDLKQNQWMSVLLFNQTRKGQIQKCDKDTGKISFNTWKTTDYISSVPFTSHTEGYACFKIPTLLKTQKGTLIAFSEARTPGCDDFDRTELVYKRSFDGGKTWSPLNILVNATTQDTGYCNHSLVIGNISPVQLRNDSKKHPGRILAPYTKNNFKLWIVYSDDDGDSWQGNRQIPNVSQTASQPDCNRNMSYFGYDVDQLKVKNSVDFVRFFELLCKTKNPYNNPIWTSKLKAPWQFIGVGPSQSLQLRSGRILVPGYHSPIRGLSEVPGTIPVSQLYNNFAKGFVLISDDDGQNWRLGKEWPVGQGANEHQMVQLDDGTVLSNSRSLSTGSPQFRVQSLSFTQGQSFSMSNFTTIPQPFAGCQGSTAGGTRGKIYVTSPYPHRGKSVVQYLTDALGCGINLNGRQRLSLWTSIDNGKTYNFDQIIDPGLSAQTSLQLQKGKLLLLYEQADPLPKTLSNTLQEQLIRNLRVLLPSRFVYRQILLSK